jgi:hypothetical protein
MNPRAFATAIVCLGLRGAIAEDVRDEPAAAPGRPTFHHRGLHGYIGFDAERPPRRSEYGEGVGFYSAAWSLIDRPLAHFQVGLASTWILPDNSDNKDRPLAPEGTLARTWPERGPTWDSVFQTIEGGLGYWAGNHFRYGPPKFSMNATPQCYDYEVGSPGWSFFYSDTALPDERLGIAQLSNRLLIPPDGLPFEETPRGEFLGYAWMALPFTRAESGAMPTGDRSWTCFLAAANFKGPIAFYIPETWSKIAKLFDDDFLIGRGLDARPGTAGGGAMEINTVPRFDGVDSKGTRYSKLPRLEFPVDEDGRCVLVQDVTYFSKAALFDSFERWRDGGATCSGEFDPEGAWKAPLAHTPTRYDLAGHEISGIERAFDNRVFDDGEREPRNTWGLEWKSDEFGETGIFPRYFRHDGDRRIAVPPSEVPAETGLLDADFPLATPGSTYTSPTVGAWASPGPTAGPFLAKLGDGSEVTYSWYRFVDQPSFQQYGWSAEKKDELQRLVEKIHAQWPIDRDYLAPPSRGELVRLDPGLFVTPPAGLEVGYVPIVTMQRAP